MHDAAGATAVDILACETCASPVPLGDGERARCLHCGAERDIPLAHRTARDANRRRGAAEVAAEAAFRGLGRLPPWYARIWAVIPWWALLAFAAIPAISLAVRFYFGTFAGLPGAWRLAISVGAPASALVMILVLGSWGERRATSLGRIQAALAARPPARPGGPAGCRRCGAPLLVPADGYGVRCPYCAADNLTRIPLAWATRMAGSAAVLDDELDAAWTRDRRERRRAGWRALGRAALLVIPLVGFTVWGYRLRTPDWLPPWQEARRGQVVYRHDGRDGDRPVMTKIPARLCEPAWHLRHFEARQCDGRGCGTRFFLPLAAGTRARAALDTPGARLTVRRRGDAARRALAIVDGAGEVGAERDGWHEVELDVPGAIAGDRFALCFALPP